MAKRPYTYWFIFGPSTKLPFGICSIYFDLTLVFQIPCQEVWKDPLRAEPQEVFGRSNTNSQGIWKARVKVKYLVHNLPVVVVYSITFQKPHGIQPGFSAWRRWLQRAERRFRWKRSESKRGQVTGGSIRRPDVWCLSQSLENGSPENGTFQGIGGNSEIGKPWFLASIRSAWGVLVGVSKK